MLLPEIDKSVLEECKYIIPVPASKKRMRWYFYNQAQDLAEELSYVTGIPVKCDVLVNNGNGKKTARLNKQQRKEKVKNLFSFNKRLNGECVLLIDDVVTTGTTLRECSEQLIKAGAGKIYCCAIARTDLG